MSVVNKQVLNSVLNVPDRGDKGLGVYVQDQSTEVLNISFLQSLFSNLSLLNDTQIDSKVITLSPGHGLVAGSLPLDHYPLSTAGAIMEIASGSTGRFIQAEIVSVVGNVVTLDQAIGDVFTVEDAHVHVGQGNLMLVDGSVTPVIFSVKPDTNQEGDITSITFAASGPDAMDFSTMGGDAPLINGIVFRSVRSDGSYKNIANFKTNGDMILFAYNALPLVPKAGNATKGLAIRSTFSGQENQGVVLRLSGKANESLQIVVQDNLTAVTRATETIRFMAAGSEVQH